MRLERCLFLSCPTAFDGILNSVVPLRSGRLPLAKPGNPRARVGEDSTNVRELPLEGPGAVHARRTAAALPRSRLALDPAALRDAATHALATRCTYWQLLGRLWGYRAKCALFPPQPPSHPPQCPFPPPLSSSVAVPPSAAVWSIPLRRVLWFFSINYYVVLSQKGLWSRVDQKSLWFSNSGGWPRWAVPVGRRWATIKVIGHCPCRRVCGVFVCLLAALRTLHVPLVFPWCILSKPAFAKSRL